MKTFYRPIMTQMGGRLVSALHIKRKTKNNLRKMISNDIVPWDYISTVGLCISANVRLT